MAILVGIVTRLGAGTKNTCALRPVLDETTSAKSRVAAWIGDARSRLVRGVQVRRCGGDRAAGEFGPHVDRVLWFRVYAAV